MRAGIDTVGLAAWQMVHSSRHDDGTMGAISVFGTACKSSVCWSVLLVLILGVRSVQDAIFAVRKDERWKKSMKQNNFRVPSRCGHRK